MKDLLIIIPAYNEEDNIGALLDQLEKAEIAQIADVLVLDDHSTDGTGRLVKRRGYELVANACKPGYGGVLRLGYRHAVRRGYQYVIQVDADGQHDVCNIPVIYRELKMPDAEGRMADIVLGSRFMEGSSAYRMSRIKRAAIGLFRRMIRWGTGQTILDPTSGLQGLNRRTFLFYSQCKQFDDRYPDANMIIQMLLLGFHIREIPAVMHPRRAGTGMFYGLKPAGYMLHMFFGILAVEFRIKILKRQSGGNDNDAIIFPEKQMEF